MTTVRDLHEAMEKAEKAMFARQRGHSVFAAKLSRQAYALEREAADQLEAKPESEPSRSVIYRSAAWLAFNGNMVVSAEDAALQGLAGQPPGVIRAELEDVLKQAREAMSKGDEHDDHT